MPRKSRELFKTKFTKRSINCFHTIWKLLFYSLSEDYLIHILVQIEISECFHHSREKNALLHGLNKELKGGNLMLINI